MVKLNPDQEVVAAIKFRLAITNGYCPCVPEEIDNPDYLCPCKTFRDTYHCCCNLYVEVEE